MPAILVITPSEENRTRLQQVFTGSDWNLVHAKTFREALLALCRDWPPIIICEHPLPDGSWKDILSLAAPLPDAPSLIVTSRFADDHLWSEVLNLGGHDVLMQPLDENEVLRVVAAAGRKWEDNRNEWRKRRGKTRTAAA